MQDQAPAVVAAIVVGVVGSAIKDVVTAVLVSAGISLKFTGEVIAQNRFAG